MKLRDLTRGADDRDPRLMRQTPGCWTGWFCTEAASVRTPTRSQAANRKMEG